MNKTDNFETVSGTEAEETTEKEDYSAYLENKLERVLAQMEVSDNGESVVEKDASGSSTTTTENDSSGGVRTVTEEQSSETTIYLETDGESRPYVQKEKLPSIEGVIVVAEGGENSRIVSEISEAVEALFSVEAHKIKVVKMSSKEE